MIFKKIIVTQKMALKNPTNKTCLQGTDRDKGIKMSKTIKLTQGKETIVDTEDYKDYQHRKRLKEALENLDLDKLGKVLDEGEKKCI